MAAKTFALKVGIGAVDRLTRPFKRIQSVIDRTTGPVRRLTQRMAVMGRAAGVTKLKKAFTSLHRNVVGIGTDGHSAEDHGVHHGKHGHHHHHHGHDHGHGHSHDHGPSKSPEKADS